MLLTVETFANEITIVAKVNQIPITNFDIESRAKILEIMMPEFGKYKPQEKNQIALQNLVQDALRQEYISKTGFKISKDEEKKFRKEVLKMLAMQKIGNLEKFVRENEEFITLQVLWQGVMEKSFMENVNVTDEMVKAVKKNGVKLKDDEIRQILIQKQLESYSAGAIDSIRKVSIVEIMD